MKTLRNVILAAGMIVLGGCTVFSSFSEVNALNEAQAVGSPFTQALAEEYKAFSNNELKEMFDYPDALHFARKGLSAAAGEVVMPEPVADWNLDEAHIQELGAARGRLILAYDWGARESKPQVAARAQAKFDCWIEGQEENWQDAGGEQACKNEFMQAMTDLEAGLQPPAEEPLPADGDGMFGVDAGAPMAPENAMYLVFFDWDSSQLTAGANNVLDAVAQEVNKNPPQSLNVVGHADTSGPTDYNQRLAFKRANAVRDALIQRGVDANLLVVDARGETELLVPTPDNVREPANRRVNISFN
jgi:OOP family OmpA-OmpF porin